jgi:hypothetical protein
VRGTAGSAPAPDGARGARLVVLASSLGGLLGAELRRASSGISADPSDAIASLDIDPSPPIVGPIVARVTFAIASETAERRATALQGPDVPRGWRGDGAMARTAGRLRNATAVHDGGDWILLVTGELADGGP